ncbi:probable serine/threonine-protein kinase kinX isoform X2 [Ischnura elegans]|nr:probable serine/threonine-protein kinase kinX isoform X2 [Ischnura elegans]
MDEGEEMSPPKEGPDHVPDNQLTMPAEGEIYMPEEGADIHAQTMQLEETDSGHTTVITTTETHDSIIHHETVEYESEVVSGEEEEIHGVEVSDFSEEEEEYVEEDEGGDYDENEGSVDEEHLQDDHEAIEDSSVDMEVIHSSEASEVTAYENIKEVGETQEVASEEMQTVPEPLQVEKEPTPPKPVEELFKFEVVMKSKDERKTEFDLILSKRPGMLWGFKIKGGRDLDIPLEVKEVHAGSIAEKAGLKVEDMIVAINDANILDLSHRLACRAILDAGDNLKISVLRAEDANMSIEIKEAYKKVQVQVTEEYQLVDNDPNTLGIDVRKSEEGEVAVIIKGAVLDSDEVALLSVNKHYKQETITDEVSHEPITQREEKVMWSANVSTPEPPTAIEEAPPTFPAPEVKPPEPEVKPPEPEPVAPPKEEEIVPPPVPETKIGEYEPPMTEEEQKAYDLIIGKIHYVPPSERPYPKSYFYKPKQGDLRKVNWPPKSNISSKIVKPRVIREDELERERSATPAPPGIKAASHPVQKAPSPAPPAADQPKTEAANMPSEQVGGGVTESAAPTQETKEPAATAEAPQTDSTQAPVDSKPAAPEGESQVATEAVPAGSIPVEASQNEAQNPVAAPEEVKVEQSVEPTPQPPSE